MQLVGTFVIRFVIWFTALLITGLFLSVAGIETNSPIVRGIWTLMTLMLLIYWTWRSILWSIKIDTIKLYTKGEMVFSSMLVFILNFIFLLPFYVMAIFLILLGSINYFTGFVLVSVLPESASFVIYLPFIIFFVLPFPGLIMKVVKSIIKK
tara:strand:- start:732 stop:1187 length:456 start_codon:yes stop_codon:yes gene_type:complete